MKNREIQVDAHVSLFRPGVKIGVIKVMMKMKNAICHMVWCNRIGHFVDEGNEIMLELQKRGNPT